MKLISFRTIHAIHSNHKIMWVVNPHYFCQLGFRQNLNTFRSKRVSQVIAHNSNYIYCQDLYDLVSCQHMNVCPTGFHKVRLVNWQETVDLRTVQNTIQSRPCNLHALFSPIVLMILMADVSFPLSFTYGTNVIIPGNAIFLKYFSLKFWELMLLRFLTRKYQLPSP